MRILFLAADTLNITVFTLSNSRYACYAEEIVFNFYFRSQ